jgi:hypothetical protein
LSDLGVIARARHEIDIYQPWAAGMDYTLGEYDKDIKAEFAKKFVAVTELDINFNNLSLAKVGMPSDGKFQYPSDRRRTKQATETMRNAEQNLDLFWKSVDQQYENKTGRSLYQAIRHLFAEERELERTPEWIEPIKESRKKNELEDSGLDKMLSQFRIDHKEQSLTEITTSKAKVKTKGVGLSGELDTPSPAPQPASHAPDIQPILTVSKRASKVFSTLFHTPSQPD